MEKSTAARKATVQQIDALNRLGLQYADWGGGGNPVPRPFVGGIKTGLHAAPNVGDQVAVVHEVWSKPIAALSIADEITQESLMALGPGETVTLHSDGRLLGYLRNNGNTVLFQSANGLVSLTITASTNRIDLNASGGVYANGTLLA